MITDQIAIQQEIINERLQEQYFNEQEQIIIEDYFFFLSWIGRIRYARWCMWEYNCYDDRYDCSWLVKAYAVSKWILTTKQASWHNSQTIVKLWDKKDAESAKRWDFTSRYAKWLVSGTTHFAVVSRDYLWDGVLWIYDNVNGSSNNYVSERAIDVHSKYWRFYYAWKYIINVYSNWLVKHAKENNIEVVPESHNTNLTGYVVTIEWFPEDSDATRIASYRYNNIENKTVAIDMIATMMAESMFNKDAVGSMWELWICQLAPAYNKVFINDPKRSTPMWQAELCLTKRSLVEGPRNLWWGWANRQKHKANIHVFDTNQQ